MPDTFREGTWQGNKTFEVLKSVSRDGTEYWQGGGLKFWQAVLENIDQARAWVDRQENTRGHNNKL